MALWLGLSKHFNSTCIVSRKGKLLPTCHFTAGTCTGCVLPSKASRSEVESPLEVASQPDGQLRGDQHHDRLSDPADITHSESTMWMTSSGQSRKRPRSFQETLSFQGEYLRPRVGNESHLGRVKHGETGDIWDENGMRASNMFGFVYTHSVSWSSLHTNRKADLYLQCKNDKDHSAAHAWY